MCATAPARPSQGAADRDVGPRVVKRTRADVRRKPAKSQPQTRKGLPGRQRYQKKDDEMNIKALVGQVIGTCISRLLVVFVCNLHTAETGQSGRGRRQPS